MNEAKPAVKILSISPGAKPRYDPVNYGTIGFGARADFPQQPQGTPMQDQKKTSFLGGIFDGYVAFLLKIMLILGGGLLILGIFVGASNAEERYNPMSNQWETVGSGEDSLRYNPMADSWSYESDGAELRYQPMQDDWQYEQTEPDPYPSQW